MATGTVGLVDPEKVLRNPSGYAKAYQFKRARKSTKQLETFPSRVVRDIKRKITAPDIELQHLLELGHQLLTPQWTDQFAAAGFNFWKRLRAFFLLVSIFQVRIFPIGLPIGKMPPEKVW